MLKKRLYTTILSSTFILVGLTFSCSKNPKCWGDNKEKGIIESSIEIDCEPTTNQQNFIITNDSTFQQTFINTATGQPQCTLPSIDFNTYSLLGLFADGQCEVKFIREVSKLDNEQKYNYKVTVKSCGACKKNGYSFNWVTVPKIPNGWTVTFEKENK